MSVDFSFGQMVAVCEAMQDISPDKRTAFTSRLKHLINPGTPKVGILETVGENRPGRGKAAKFSFSQVMKVVIGVELLQAGTPPALAAKLVQANWLSLRVGVNLALYNDVELRKAGQPREEIYWIVAPEALRDLSSVGDGQYDHHEAIATIFKRADLLAHFEEHEVEGVRGHYRRQLVLNGTAITRAAAFIITNELHAATMIELQGEMFDEIDRDQKRLDQAIAEFSSGGISDESTKELSKMLPVFQQFDREWRRRVEAHVEKLTPHQKSIMSSNFGDTVHIEMADLKALRDLDLIGVHQGELVITDLGQEVGHFLREEAGESEDLTPQQLSQLHRRAEVAARLQAKRDGSHGDS